jgi:beta-galactosidase/beta-glucuronidase
MGSLIKRDRNHPSVVIWSFCNEGACEGSHEKGGPAFQAISEQFDGSRPTLANMFTFGDLLSNTIDVQGCVAFSLASKEHAATFPPGSLRSSRTPPFPAWLFH